jgi:1-acyl-sn-glycerol-3-phosphate acyltransferase
MLMHRLIPGYHVAFRYKFLGISFRARSKALKGLYTTEEWVKSSREVMRLLERCGGRFHVSGLRHIRESKDPVVLIGNHMSTLETMVLPFLISQTMDCTFVVKDSLVKSRAFGPIMRSRDPIVVSRHNSRDDLMLVINRGQEILAGGRSVVIFPQSTRRMGFNPEEFNSLGVKLASKAGLKVIPFALKTDFWLNGRLVKDLGPLEPRNRDIWFEFGEPMEIRGTGKEENRQIIEFIASRLERWRVK